MNWEREVEIAGFEGEYSRVALRMLMLILFRQETLDNIMEKPGSKVYWALYYKRHRDKILEARKRNLMKKYGMTEKEYAREYCRENRDRIREYHRKYNRKYKERKKLERLWG